MKRCLVATAFLSSVFAAALVFAQRNYLPSADDDIPQAALLTERGAELANRLKLLRRAEANLGNNHPSLPDVRKQINAIRDQLKATAPEPNPFRNRATDVKRAVPKMNDDELRQLVILLVDDVADLKKRVLALEQQK